jgi:hypothetical protein
MKAVAVGTFVVADALRNIGRINALFRTSQPSDARLAGFISVPLHPSEP